jgi:hypothetical protein
VAEDDDTTVLRGQPRQRLDQLVRKLRGERRLVSGLEHELGSQPPAPRPIDRAVDDDAVQPGAERPVAIEPVQPANCGEKGLLGNVLGRSGVMDDEVRGPER